ncbi:MAG: helix-turn-helix domain-containing protein [Proteobacteria bacterium]|nr:helix-turn-helix domain-containing protein [Pseudomonadota bacterium]
METPGLMLKREREARGMTLSELAKVTRIPESSLMSIENNNFDEFPAEVFVRGFLRNYARQLSIPADDIMQAYESWIRQQTPRAIVNEITENNTESKSLALNPKEPVTAENDDMPRTSFRFAYIAIILIAIASLGLSALFVGNGEAEESDADFSIQSTEASESPFLISNTSEGWIAE